MVAVAEAAGLSQTGLLHHFPSKELLLAGVLQRRDEQDMAALDGGTEAHALGGLRPARRPRRAQHPP